MLRERVISVVSVSLSAILLSLSMPRAGIDLSVLEWFALVPWFLTVKKEKNIYAFLLSLWVGILFWGMTVYWLCLVTGLGFLLLLPYLGLYFAISGWCMGYILKNGRLFITFTLGPLAWFFFEALRGFLLGGFPWLNLSHAQYLNIPLLQLSSFGGGGIISLLVILVNLIIVETFLARRKAPFVLALFLILSFSHITGYILLKYSAKKKQILRVGVIQPNIIDKWNEEFEEEKFGILMDLSYSSLSYSPQFLVWPETAFSYDLEKEKLHRDILKKFAREHRLYLLAGSVKELSHKKFYNQAVLISPDGDISSYNKVRLVPFGEYVPLGDILPQWKRWVEHISGYRFSFVPGKEEKLLYIDRTPFGVLICFEDIFPSLSRKLRKKGARFLVNITDDRWFGETPAPYQHLAASVFRAVENNIPVVRSANTGVSAVIDSCGRITGMVKDRNKAIFVRGVLIRDILL